MTVKYIYLSDTSSTNAFAQSYTSKCKPNEITVIYTYNQHAGKGQIGRHWFGDKNKNYSFSIVYFPKHLKAANSFQVIIDSSLAICSAIERVFGIHCHVKWPNDIYHENQKLGGILIQTVISGKNIKTVIVGCGINVNTVDFPDHLPNPTSISQILKKEQDLKQLFVSFTEYICELLTREPYTLDDYHKKMYRINQQQQFIDSESMVFEATIKGVDNNGLLVLHKDGLEQKYNFHELKFVI